MVEKDQSQIWICPKVSKRNEETYRAYALAANFDTGNIKGFWKCIKD